LQTLAELVPCFIKAQQQIHYPFYPELPALAVVISSGDKTKSYGYLSGQRRAGLTFAENAEPHILLEFAPILMGF